ncbi:MAG: hypothetical protein PHV37_05920 [Candidatus Gastranaerophilales bacterium]|nr:hypothetical protein [Candidatus Gastranaerophilales bacterium]
MPEVVPFDPGFAPLVENFSSSIDIVHQVLFSIKNFNQKKLKYRMFEPKIFALIKNNVGFYAGCLLWAYFLVNEYKDYPRSLSGNVFASMTPDEIENYDFNQEIDFITVYLETYVRDAKYYLSKNVNLDKKITIILSLYKEFLNLNDGSFIGVKTTADICLPKMLSDFMPDFNVKKEIDIAINTKSLEHFLTLNLF